MKTRIYNAMILPMDGGYDLIRDGEIHIDNDRISYVGPSADAPAFNVQTAGDTQGSETNTIDAEGNLILPGFKNAHTHSAMTFLRSYADDLPLQEWLNDQIFPMEARLKPEHVLWFTKLAIMEYLTSGVTANFDMYFYPEMIAQAAIETGFRTVMMRGLNNFASTPEEVDGEFERLNSLDPLVTYKLGFHAEYTCSEELLKAVAELSAKYQAPVHAHVSETKRECDECVERHGLTPVRYLDSLGLLDHGGCFFHGIWLDDEEIGICKDRGIYIITNPASNLKLSSGIARTADLLRAGVGMGVATDGPASNNCLDMFREMFLVTGLAKIREHDAAAVPAEDVLKMATVTGAHAMGLEDCDGLAPGKKADLIMIDMKQPNMQPVNHPLKNLVYSGSKSNVKMTMVDGRILYRDGTFDIGVEPEEVYSTCAELIARDFR